MSGFLTPDARLREFTNLGVVAPGAQLLTQLSGTSTNTPVYADAALTTQLTNPVMADASGLFPAIFLDPAITYRFTLTDANGATIWPAQDGISVAMSGGGGSGGSVTGTFGDTVTANQGVYLSNGSGGKNAGQWYKWDSANAYSSTTPEIGLAPSAVNSGATGTIQQSGRVTGLTALATGGLLYIGTAGALTATPPVNRRLVGQADTPTSMILPSPTPDATPSIASDGVLLDDTESDIALAANVLTLDLAQWRHYKFTLNAALNTMTINNPLPANRASVFVLKVTGDGSAHAWAWFTGTVKWASGVVPTPTTTAAHWDMYAFVSYDAGATWMGFVLDQNFS